MSFNPLLFSNLPYNPDDLVPLARLFFLVEGVFASTRLDVNSIAELKALAQSKPDALNYATLGEGSYPDLFMKWMNNQWGTKIVGIPYRAAGRRRRRWRPTRCRSRGSASAISSAWCRPAR